MTHHAGFFSMRRWPLVLMMAAAFLAVPQPPCRCAALSPEQQLAALLAPGDSCILASLDGTEQVACNADAPLVPASILKLLTALSALHHLGENYKFNTDFYRSKEGDILVRGFGDPLLVSEVLRAMAVTVRQHFPVENPVIGDIVLDDTYFAPALSVPGVSNSLEPYDAPNGALCANFNTVAFERGTDGGFVSAEPQTPLLPWVLERIRGTGQSQGRIVLSPSRTDITGYTGRLLRFFLLEAGCRVTGRIRFGTVDTDTTPLLVSCQSPYPLTEVISGLMAHSNNFIANQLLIASGAAAFDAPGTIEKGVRATKAYAAVHLGLHRLDIVEGSGISRKNNVSARTMLRIARAFYPHRFLLRRQPGSFYKTGTLNGVSTRTGFLDAGADGDLVFVVMLNQHPENMSAVMRILEKIATSQRGMHGASSG